MGDALFRMHLPTMKGDFDEMIAELTRRSAEEAARHREMFTAAYFSKTHLDPRDAVLVERHTGTGTHWYFTNKADIRGQEDVDALLAENASLAAEVNRLRDELRRARHDD